MYQIKCDDHVLYDPRDDDLILLNPKCKLEANTVGEGSFTILSNHPYYKELQRLKSIFEIRQDDHIIFRGRMTNESKDFHNRLDVDLEGVLGFTNDTIILPFSHSNEAHMPGEHTFTVYSTCDIDREDTTDSTTITIGDESGTYESDTSVYFHAYQGGGECIKGNLKILYTNNENGIVISYMADGDIMKDTGEIVATDGTVLSGSDIDKWGLSIKTDTENTVETFLAWVLQQHNSQVEPWQQLKLGNVKVFDPNNYITRSSEKHASTWEILKTKLFESSLGGYLTIRYEADGNYVDYLDKFDVTAPQQITFGKNLLDITHATDANETYSAILPIGKDGLTLNGSTVKDLTNDLVQKGQFVYSKSAKEQYGWICAPVDNTTWDDITTVDELESAAMKYLSGTAMLLSDTIEIQAVDLAFTDDQIQSFRIYQNVIVNSPVHGISGIKYPLTKLEIDITNPQNTKITLGETKRVLTDRTNQETEKVKRTSQDLSTIRVELNDKVGNTDNDQVVAMVNNSTSGVKLTNRLVVESDKFGMDEDGTIHASGGDVAGFEFDGSGLRKTTVTYDSGSYTNYTEKQFEVAPGYLQTTTDYKVDGATMNKQSVRLADGVIEVTNSGILDTVFDVRNAFMKVSVNGSRYNLFIDPDTLAIKVVEE